MVLQNTPNNINYLYIHIGKNKISVYEEEKTAYKKILLQKDNKLRYRVKIKKVKDIEILPSVKEEEEEEEEVTLEHKQEYVLFLLQELEKLSPVETKIKGEGLVIKGIGIGNKVSTNINATNTTGSVNTIVNLIENKIIFTVLTPYSFLVNPEEIEVLSNGVIALETSHYDLKSLKDLRVSFFKMYTPLE